MEVVIPALSGLIGVGLTTLVLRKPRSRKLDAEATVAEATAAQTVSETVKGLLGVMQNQLDRARAEVLELREAMDAQVAHCDAELAELRAEIADLEKRLFAAEHPEDP